MNQIEVMKQVAKAIEKLAFEMPAPNPYTPRFVMLANELMRQAIEQAEKQKPYGWMVRGVPTVMRGSIAEEIQKQEARHIGGDCVAFPVYLQPTAPAQGLFTDMIAHHEAHCYQDEYADSCKYGDADCPMKPTAPAQPVITPDDIARAIVDAKRFEPLFQDEPTAPSLPLESSQEANDAIRAMLAEYNYPANTQNAGRAGWRAARLYAPTAPAQPEHGCACRWDANDKRVATCVRHQGWLDVVSEWAERAKAAEAHIKGTSL